MSLLISSNSSRGLFFPCKCGVSKRQGPIQGDRDTDVPSDLGLELSLTGRVLTNFLGEVTSNFLNQDWEVVSLEYIQDEP